MSETERESIFFNANFREWAKTQPEFTNMTELYLDTFEGCCLCDCGAGCRDFVADNGAKVVAITRGIKAGLDQATLDAMAEKDPKAFLHDLHQQAWDEAKAERKAKNAPES